MGSVSVRKGGTGGGEWCHPQGDMHKVGVGLVAVVAGCRNAMVGTGDMHMACACHLHPGVLNDTVKAWMCHSLIFIFILSCVYRSASGYYLCV